MNEVLSVRQLSLSRGGMKVLHDVSITVQAGEIVALLGSNGAGKSSLVLGAAGMIPIDKGEVLIDGSPCQGSPPNVIRAAKLAAVPEGHHVLASLTVQENLTVAGASLNKSEMTNGVDAAYAIFPELTDRRNQLAGSLSGGQQQMVVLGQAIVSQPRVILADEMSLGLAPLIVHRLLDVTKSLAEQGIGILLIEQFTHLALGIADRAYVIDRGQVTFSGTPTEIEAHPEVLRDAYFAGS